MNNSKGLESRTVTTRRHKTELFLTLSPLNLSSTAISSTSASEPAALPKPSVLSDHRLEQGRRREINSVTIQVHDLDTDRHTRRHSWLLKPSTTHWFNTFPVQSKPVIRVSVGPCFAHVKTMHASSSQPNVSSTTITSDGSSNQPGPRRSQVSMNIDLVRQTSEPVRRPSSGSPCERQRQESYQASAIKNHQSMLRSTGLHPLFPQNPPTSKCIKDENTCRNNNADRPSQLYTQALVQHQEERLLVLLRESKRIDHFLDELRADVTDLEKKVSQSTPQWHRKKRLQDEIHSLMIDCACLSMEIDMYKVDIPLGTTDERAYRNLSPSGPRSSSIEIETVSDYPGHVRPIEGSRSPTSPVRQPTNHMMLPNNGCCGECRPFNAYRNTVQASLALNENQSTRRETINNNSDEVEGKWPCLECTFMNHPDLNRCEICEMPRSGYLRPCEGNIKEDSGFTSFPNKKPSLREPLCYCHKNRP